MANFDGWRGHNYRCIADDDEGGKLDQPGKLDICWETGRVED